MNSAYDRPLRITPRNVWAGLSPRGRLAAVAVGGALVLVVGGSLGSSGGGSSDSGPSSRDRCVSAMVAGDEYAEGKGQGVNPDALRALADQECSLNDDVPNTP